MPLYLQPIARHPIHPERFLLRGEDDGWYVWTGTDPECRPEEIPAATAAWLLARCRLLPLAPTAWVHADDLPLATHRDPLRRVG